MSNSSKDIGPDQFAWQRVASLTPSRRNPRTHSKRQIRQLAASIETFGWINPIIVDEEGRIIAGHGRLEAAKLLDHEMVPTIRIDHLTEARKRAYVIADNRLAELAGWDRELLAIELQELEALDVDLGVIGFDVPEIDILIDGAGGPTEPDSTDTVPPLPAEAVSRPGDLFMLGRHRLLCGDARDPESYRALLQGDRAQMAITDPPYNVVIDGHARGKGQHRHREFACASGEMTPGQFTAFLEDVFEPMARWSEDGALAFVFMDWRHLREALEAGTRRFSRLINLAVWVKSNGGMGSFYRSRHELVLVFKNGRAPHINNIELGRHGRNRSNVWEYAGVNSFGAGREEALAMHPTVKPMALVAEAIRDASHRSGIVLDPFLGSGTTIMAAEQTGRRGCGIEIDPLYVDTAIRRWEDLTGDHAVHAGSGLRVADLAARRLTEVDHG